MEQTHQPLTLNLPILKDGYAAVTVTAACTVWGVSRSTARKRLEAAALAKTSSVVLHDGRYCSAQNVYLLPESCFETPETLSDQID